MVNFKSLPKVELHLHLDCSLSYQVVKKIAPNISLDVYKESFIAPPKCTDLADYISRAVKGVELMQTTNQLQLVTQDLIEQLQNDNVIYAEIRFAPLLHTQKGLTPTKVVEVVNNALEEGINKTKLEANLILCTLRHFSEEESMETVRLVNDFKGTKVVGFDIAADEAGFPIDNHISAFKYAKQNYLNVTAHAGEAKGSESVWETLQHFQPSRLGHGVRSIEDAKLIAHLIEKNIHLEVCPTSNIQTNVMKSMKTHPINDIYESGISMSINTDARTISDITLTDEYKNLQENFNWDVKHFLKCNLEAIEHAFIPNSQKSLLKNRLIELYIK